MKRIFRFSIVFVCLIILTALFLQSQNAVFARGSESVDLSTFGSASSRVTRFLVLGKDRSVGLADCIMIVTVCEDSGAVSVVQIPRDTYAEYTHRDYKKLNGILQEKGETGAKDFLSSALGVPLDYFLILDLDCLDRLVDAVGGVEIDIPQDMYYSDPTQGLEIDLRAGNHLLNGKEAEQFVRYRAGYANADLGRLDAQKLFLRAFVKKCNAMSGADKVKLVLSVLAKVQTDVDLPAILRVQGLFGNFDADAIPMTTLPGQAVQGSSGAWYYSLNKEGCIEILNDFLLPESILNQDSFDPKGLFDREDHKDFHNIYIASQGDLPLG